MSVLSSVVDRVSANPLLGFVPHGGQECFLGGLPGLGGGLVGSRFYLGGNRSGKSTVGVVDDLVQCLPVEFVPSWLVGFKRRGVSRVRCVAPSLKDQVLGVLVPKFREWCPAAALVGRFLNMFASDSNGLSVLVEELCVERLVESFSCRIMNADVIVAFVISS